MTRSMRDKWSYAQYQAWLGSSRTPEEEAERMALVPNNMRRRVENHMETVKKIRSEHQMRKRRREDERKK